MTTSWQCIVGGISGAVSVGAAAYGSHGLKCKNERNAKSFDNGARLQMLHSVLLSAVPSICNGRSRAAVASGTFLTFGMVLFSGSCYAVGITEDRNYGRAAPWGGVCLMAGWLSLGLIRK